MKKNKKWKLVSSSPVFESKWLSILSNSYELPNGEIGNDYLHLKRPDYVLILAVGNKGNLVLQRNYRRGVDDFVYELPAGWINDGETSEQAAIREFNEETGFVGEAKSVKEIYPQPGFSSMKAYVVLMEFDEDMKGEQRLSVDENVDFELRNIEEIGKQIKSGEIKDMGLLAALTLL